MIVYKNGNSLKMFPESLEMFFKSSSTGFVVAFSTSGRQGSFK
jgi:hypothetical protein